MGLNCSTRGEKKGLYWFEGRTGQEEGLMVNILGYGKNSGDVERKILNKFPNDNSTRFSSHQ